jgi:N-sulfoglucosamine sulfohydrolase
VARTPRLVSLLSLVLLPAGCDAGEVQAAVPQAGDRPNILWIVADDLSPDLGAYGDAYARTPNIDRLAQEGVRFTNAFATSPVCAPARSTLITGVYASTLGSLHMRSWAVPPPHVRPFSEALRAAGYFTSNNRKIDYNFNPHLEESVWRAVVEPPLGAWDESGAEAHWRHRGPGQPFFAVFDLFVTHEGRIRLPEAQFDQAIAAVATEDRHLPSAAPLPPYYPDTPETRRDMARYYDLITAADLQLADILGQLAADGLEENTVVVFFADHGRGLPRAKRWVYDSGIRVPLVVRWPRGLASGVVRHELVSFVDFAPTMLSLAGVEVPDHMQGRVFLGDRAQPEPRYVFATRDRMDETPDTIRAVRDRRFKYLRNFQPDKPYAQPIAYMDEMPTMKVWRQWAAEGRLQGPQQRFFAPRKPQEELYDLTADPHEIHNLAEDPQHQARLVEMRTALERWMEQTRDLGLLPEKELIARMRPPARPVTTEAPAATVQEDGTTDRVTVSLACPTPGAAIVYTRETGATPHWLLYTGPLHLPPTAVLRFKAGRLGFEDSREISLALDTLSSEVRTGTDRGRLH